MFGIFCKFEAYVQRLSFKDYILYIVIPLEFVFYFTDKDP